MKLKIKQLFCRHQWEGQIQFFLPARKCSKCDKRQIQLPGIGTLDPFKWVDAKSHSETANYKAVENQWIERK